MKYSVKIIIKSTVESREVSLEESVLMMDADSFDDAYDKAERYVEERGICDTYRNYEGKRVTREIVSYADCFAPFEDDEDDVIEVYSSIIRPDEKLTEETIVAVLKRYSTRKDLLPFREIVDTDELDEDDSLE